MANTQIHHSVPARRRQILRLARQGGLVDEAALKMGSRYYAVQPRYDSSRSVEDHEAESTPKKVSQEPSMTDTVFAQVDVSEAVVMTRATRQPTNRNTAHGPRQTPPVRRKPQRAIHVSASISPLPGVLSCRAICSRAADWTCSQWTGHLSHGASCSSRVAPGLRLLLQTLLLVCMPGPTLLFRIPPAACSLPRPRIGCHMNFSGPQQTSGAEEREGLRCKTKFLSPGGHPTGGGFALSAVFAFRTAVATGHFLGITFRGQESGLQAARETSRKLANGENALCVDPTGVAGVLSDDFRN